MKIDKIETPRLFLRNYEKSDMGFVMSIWNDPEMGKYMPDPTIDNIDDEYRRSLETLDEYEPCCYLIYESKVTGESIGTCSFVPSEDGLEYDIAYCVHDKYSGNGYATEMAQGMIDYARQHGAIKITVCVNKENAASNAIVNKLNFKAIGNKSYNKRGTNLIFNDYKYELVI